MNLSQHKKKIKCVVWDMDNTLWKGILLEDEQVELSSEIVNLIIELDKRGILNSIASKNNFDDVMNKLQSFDIDKYFLYPEINWNNKSDSIKRICRNLNIGLDSVAFIDDQQFELDEVHYNCAEVLCVHKNELENILDREEFIPTFITDESKCRREMYQSEEKRKHIEDNFDGPKIDFLKSLNMVLTIKEAELEDLKRVEELTIRTHQLNTTGYTYSYDELKKFIILDKYKLYVVQLDDKYGTYGKIGIMLVERGKDKWTIRLLLLSCRVMSRGVGNMFINFIVEKAREDGIKLYAEFKHTDKNRMMYITYKLMGFKETMNTGGHELLEYDFSNKVPRAEYILVKGL